MAKKLTKDEVINLCRKYHGIKYDYSDMIYINKRTNIIVFCTIHNTYFEVNPRNHWQDGVRCENCFEEDKLKLHIEKANQKHNNIYDYSLLDLGTRARNKVKIRCKIHGIFEQNFANHLNGQGCPNCAKAFWGWTETKFKSKCKDNLRNFLYNSLF